MSAVLSEDDLRQRGPMPDDEVRRYEFSKFFLTVRLPGPSVLLRDDVEAEVSLEHAKPWSQDKQERLKALYRALDAIVRFGERIEFEEKK